ncbi:helix-turn-helix transcriptional regulator [Longispora sp. K20-0274]|uniref:helix-turn-helix domain-containing protein n=1 Tax=Longispora sp. K20-0274 TaxID=3088255 RepID=UPI00399B28BA
MTSNMLSRYIGGELRRYRDALGLTQDQAADHLNMSRRTMIRVEAGDSRISMGNLRTLLDLYNVTNEVTRHDLETMQREAKRPGLLSRELVNSSATYKLYVEHEQWATAVTTYGALLVPGLLQTESYARAVQTTGLGSSDPEMAVKLRMERQHHFFARAPLPDLCAVIDEAVLRRVIGTPATMAAQLHHIANFAEAGRYTVRVIPLDTGAFLTPESFTMFTPIWGHPVVFIEGVLSAYFREDQKHVELYSRAHAVCRTAALSPASSIALIREHAGRYAQQGT